jgi:hypothetical protein
MQDGASGKKRAWFHILPPERSPDSRYRNSCILAETKRISVKEGN